MFVKVINNLPVKYPYTLGDLYKENPQTSFPSVIPDSVLELYGVYKVESSIFPDVDSKTHKLAQSVEKIGGKWTQVWTKTELPLETASNNVRSYRSRLLSESDWTQTEDSPVDKNSWKTYRQNLRDISTQEGFPYNIIWPTPPS